MTVSNRALLEWKRILSRGMPTDLRYTLKRDPKKCEGDIVAFDFAGYRGGEWIIASNERFDLATRRSLGGGLESVGREKGYPALGLQYVWNLVTDLGPYLGLEMYSRAGDKVGGSLWAESGWELDDYTPGEVIEKHERDLALLSRGLDDRYDVANEHCAALPPQKVLDALHQLRGIAQKNYVEPHDRRVLWAIAEDKEPLNLSVSLAFARAGVLDAGSQNSQARQRLRGPEALLGAHYNMRFNWRDTECVEKLKTMLQRKQKCG